ncbi:hypothetical protein F511_27057 [Dorcoceras hygrometricum]|uniref:Uncharacterized protein n=1 Tax=Dorcoceras hygrometricum TaxID=472368 RepID=A0A2Z7D1E2_9LAMI|nr:hypothetical protein F511_27057 [Dorcoceras hygrometricum]
MRCVCMNVESNKGNTLGFVYESLEQTLLHLPSSTIGKDSTRILGFQHPYATTHSDDPQPQELLATSLYTSPQVTLIHDTKCDITTTGTLYKFTIVVTDLNTVRPKIRNNKSYNYAETPTVDKHNSPNLNQLAPPACSRVASPASGKLVSLRAQQVKSEALLSVQLDSELRTSSEEINSRVQNRRGSGKSDFVKIDLSWENRSHWKTELTGKTDVMRKAVSRSRSSSTQPPRLVGKERSSQEVSNATKNSKNGGRKQRQIAIEK